MVGDRSLDGRLKPVTWMGSSRKDLKAFPRAVQAEMGHALYAAQAGDTDPAAKPLRGFGGASVMEIVGRFDGDAYRTVYSTKLGDVLYVLHAFQKKATKGIATPKHEIDPIKARLKDAERLHKDRMK